MTAFRRRILARIAAGERVHPTGKEGQALAWLRAQRYIRRRWDGDVPRDVATKAGLAALDTLPTHGLAP
jgi:hypothetical protein